MKQNIDATAVLQNLLDDGIISLEDIADRQAYMTKREVLRVHHTPITSRADGRLLTKVKDYTGKWKQISAKTEKELFQKLSQHYATDIPTLADIYQKWMIHRRDNTAVKAKTLQEYSNNWKKFFADTPLSTTPITHIKPVMVLRHFQRLTKNREYSQKRISNAKSLINGVMAYAVEEGIIEHNPVLEINFRQLPYKPVENQNNVFSVEDVITLLNYLKNIKGEPYALAIQLDFNLLIRVGELKALQWSDVDWNNNTIYIHTQALIEREMNDDLSFGHRSTVVSSRMKGNTAHGYRIQPLTPEAVRILRKAQELNPFGQYIFMPDNRIMTTDSFNRRLKKYCSEAGIEYRSSHKIRFFAASAAFDGENLATVSKLMGHANTETTMHYLRDITKGTDDVNTMSRLGLENTLRRYPSHRIG
ncbi:MAG: site-specific integrase [Lachnospiraceae bacterium]|nr:site-specific integrase [Lachnospiraceae bacterium]